MTDDPQQAIAPGVLVGRYRILSLVGTGAMGEVFRAEDTALGRAVALKTLPREYVATAERLGRFENEGRVMASLSHPNLVHIYDVGEFGGVPYLVQEFIDGDTLEEVLLGGAVPVAKAARWICQAAEGLAAAHAAGILHRDIKPANIMVGRDGRVRVLDFGLAKVRLGSAGASSPGPSPRRASLTTDGLVVGTAHYMSPEQAMGKPVDQASDVFSLGVVLYELLAGKPPFEGESAVDVMYSIIHRPHPPLAGFGSGVLAPFSDVVERALAKEPADRYATMGDFARALAAALRDGGYDEEAGATQPHPPVSEKTPRAGVPTSRMRPRPPHARRRLLLAGVAAVAVAGTVAALLLLRTGSRPVPVPLTFSRPIQLTSSRGLDVFPTFAPDGRSIAYSSDRSGNFEIYRRPLGVGGREIALTSDGLQNVEPAWSPDGETIAYHARKVGGVWVIPSLGGTPRQLSTFGSRPAYSPDGSTIVFESGPLFDLAANSLGALPPSILWTIPANGGPARPLTQVGKPAGGHGAPSFSPDGKRITFASYNRTAAEIWSMAANGSDLVRLSEGTWYCYDPVYAVDGASVLYPCWSETWSVGLFRRPVSPTTGRPTGPQSEVTSFGVNGMGSVKHVALSRDGSRAAYASLAMSSNLWAVPVDPATGEPTGPIRQVTRETGRNSRPAVSRDGTKVAFSRWRPGANQDIWVVDADGSNAVQRTTDPSDDDYPGWMPDGRHLSFMSQRLGRRTLFLLDLVTGRDEKLADFGPGLDAIRVSPDGRRAAFHAAGGRKTLNVFVADLPSGKPRALTDDPELAAFPCWSPDGRTLAFEVKRGGDTHVAVVPSAGGEVRELTGGSGQAWPYSWSPDGRRIAFVGLRDGLWDVWWVDAQSGAERQVTKTGRLNTYVRYPDWSPTGTEIVFEFAETTGNIWLVEESGDKASPARASLR